MATIRDESTRAKLIERLAALKGDEKPLWGKMTAGQMVSHLVQAGDLPFTATVADRSSLSRTLIKPLVLYVLPIPKDVKTSPDMDQQENGRPPGDFAADKSLAIELINKLGTLAADHPCLGHPFFGKMSAKQWGVMSHKHVDHHLRQFGV